MKDEMRVTPVFRLLSFVFRLYFLELIAYTT